MYNNSRLTQDLHWTKMVVQVDQRHVHPVTRQHEFFYTGGQKGLYIMWIHMKKISENMNRKISRQCFNLKLSKCFLSSAWLIYTTFYSWFLRVLIFLFSKNQNKQQKYPLNIINFSLNSWFWSVNRKLKTQQNTYFSFFFTKLNVKPWWTF